MGISFCSFSTLAGMLCNYSSRYLWNYFVCVILLQCMYIGIWELIKTVKKFNIPSFHSFAEL